MSQEPEKEIEKQLRGHAEKRRAEAGDQLELHNATRRLLQAEVARTYGAAPVAPAKSSARPWWSYWPGLLFASCCVLLLAVMVIRPKQEEAAQAKVQGLAPAGASRYELAATSAQPTADAMPAAATPPPPPAEKLSERRMQPAVENPTPQVVLDVVGEKRQAPAGEPAARPVSVDQTPSLLAAKDMKADALAERNSPPPAPPKPMAVSGPVGPESKTTASGQLAPNKAETVAQDKMLAEAQTRPAVPPAAKPATTAPIALGMADETVALKKSALTVAQSNSLRMDTSGVYYAGTIANPEGKTAGQRFVQSPSRAMLRKNYQSPPSPTVLEQFQVQQNGDELKFIDSDGSVYLGNMLPPDVEKESAERETADRFGARTKVASPANAQGFAVVPGAVGGARSATEAARYFRASGMNRTLNQQVVIDGSFETAPQPALRGGSSAPAKARAEAAKQSVSPLPQLQIQGRVQVGDRQELIIKAVPVNK